MKFQLDSFLAWFSLVVAIVAVLGFPLIFRRLWRGSTILENNVVGGFWYSSDEFRRGHVRALVPIALAGYSLFLLMLVLFIIPPVPPGQVDYLGSYAVLATVVMIVIAVPLYWSVVLFNWPKFLVPPRFRGDEGALSARRARKRN